jgi:hypothetical protein
MYYVYILNLYYNSLNILIFFLFLKRRSSLTGTRVPIIEITFPIFHVDCTGQQKTKKIPYTACQIFRQISQCNDCTTINIIRSKHFL